jgi:hypothetical protein
MLHCARQGMGGLWPKWIIPEEVLKMVTVKATEMKNRLGHSLQVAMVDEEDCLKVALVGKRNDADVYRQLKSQ